LNPSLLIEEVERLKAAGRALYDLALKTGLDVEFPVLMGDAKKDFAVPDEPLQAVDPGRRISLPGDDPLYDAVRRYKILTLEAAHGEGQRKAARLGVVQPMGEAGELCFPDGTTVTRRHQTRKAYTVKETVYEVVLVDWRGSPIQV
jgi:hypothetical protein